MKDLDKLSATVEELSATVATLTTQVARLERVNRVRIDGELAAERMAERDRRLCAVAAIEDATERARAVATVHTFEDLKYVIGECDAQRLLETLEASDANTRNRLMAAMTPERSAEVACLRLPPPKRIRARAAAGSRVSTPPIVGLRKSDRYPGFSLDVGEAHVELEKTWNKRLEIDDDLREAVERRFVIVEPVSDEESKQMLYREIVSRPLESRPVLSFE